MNLQVDIDNTICETKNSDYKNSTPIQKRIDFFNKVLDSGGKIHYYTARGSASGKNWEEFTRDQLEKWGVKYTSLTFGKPDVDFIIDDKNVSLEDLDYTIDELEREKQ